MPADFHFLRPMWLSLFIPLIVFLVWFARRRFERRRWQGIVDPVLMPHVLVGSGVRERRRIAVLFALGGTLLIAALAGPVWQRLPQPVFRSRDALVIALDLSLSMDVEDLKPSRLARARFKISDILNGRKEGETALIAYAADAYVISPLTTDSHTISAQLPALATRLMPAQGSRADRALRKAAALLKQAGAGEGDILLVTDGVDSAQTGTVVRELARKGLRISVLAVGTDAGGPIPGPDGFVKRADGSIVIARLDARGLEEVARRGGGRFHRLSADSSDIDSLAAVVAKRHPDSSERTRLNSDTWREEGPWLLLPLLPLAALVFRRGVLAVWLLVWLVPFQPVHAFAWADLWSRPDQRASRLFAAGDPAAAARLFADPAWKGAAAYRAGRYADALAALKGLDETEAIFNRGNTLARLGRLDEAIAAYDEVLRRDPGHRDARYNRGLLRKLKKRKKQPRAGGGSAQHAPGQSPQAASQSAAQDRGARGGANESGGRTQRHSGGDSAPGRDAATAQPAGNARPGKAPADQQPSAATARRRSGTPPPGPSPSPGATERRGAHMPPSGSSDRPSDEDAEATEQWLRRIPDDPGGLLRRKFYYQYQKQQKQDRQHQEKEPW